MEGEAQLFAVVWQVTKFLAAFALVVFLATATSRLLAQRSRGSASATFRILGALGLGTGRSVAAVQVGRRVLVLGLGDKSVCLLATIDDPGELQPPDGLEHPRRGPFGPFSGPDFAGMLRSALDRAGGRVKPHA